MRCRKCQNQCRKVRAGVFSCRRCGFQPCLDQFDRAGNATKERLSEQPFTLEPDFVPFENRREPARCVLGTS